MRNFKNLYHWIAGLRDIARKHKLYDEDSERVPWNEQQIKEHFCKERFENQFYQGADPQEAFDEEMERWKDAE